MTDHAATPTRHWIIVTWDDQWQGEPDEIRPWFHTYPAVPGLHGEEYDAGIEVIGADGHSLLPM